MGKAVLLFSIAVVLSAFAPWAMSAEALYQRLGGREGIQAMVSDFVDMVVHDSRLRMNPDAKKFLSRANPADLKALILESVCEASGGPCKAAAANSSLGKVIHTMDLAPDDWRAIDADFSAALVKFKIGPAEQKDLRVLMDRARISIQ